MVFPTLAKSIDNKACHSEERKPPRHPEERSDAGIYLCEDAERNGRLPRLTPRNDEKEIATGESPRNDETRETKKSVILNEVKNLPVSTTDECRTSLEILRYTQDDSEEENKRNKDKNK